MQKFLETVEKLPLSHWFCFTNRMPVQIDRENIDLKNYPDDCLVDFFFRIRPKPGTTMRDAHDEVERVIIEAANRGAFVLNEHREKQTVATPQV